MKFWDSVGDFTVSKALPIVDIKSRFEDFRR